MANPTVNPNFEPRGPEKFPHWHDCDAWAQHTTMTRSRFLQMSAEEFADWVDEHYHEDEVRGLFYANRHPEGYRYATSREWLIHTCYPGYARHRRNWHPALLDTEN